MLGGADDYSILVKTASSQIRRRFRLYFLILLFVFRWNNLVHWTFRNTEISPYAIRSANPKEKRFGFV